MSHEDTHAITCQQHVTLSFFSSEGEQILKFHVSDDFSQLGTTGHHQNPVVDMYPHQKKTDLSEAPKNPSDNLFSLLEIAKV